MKKNVIIGSFLVCSILFLSVIFFSPSAVFAVFGYGYGCDGNYGYGYSCSDKKSSSQYDHYKDKYKNNTAKQLYHKIKYLKKGGDHEYTEYLRLKAIYEKYEHLSTSERRDLLTQKEYDDFKLYKKYKGYKEYKELKKSLGI